MGVSLKKIIESENVDIDFLKGKKVGVDAYNWTHQFLSTIRIKGGRLLRDSEGRVTSHLSGLFFRTAKVICSGVKPVYVWDGTPPEFKSKVLEERKERKEKAREKMKKADTEREKMKYAQQTSKLSEDNIEEAKELLSAMGIPSLDAPSEGEAQISKMVSEGDVWACASQDWDALLFGANKLVRNINVTGKRKLPGKDKYVKVTPSFVDLGENLDRLGVSREQLVIAGMLMGTDYTQGVKGYGPKRSLKVVKEKDSLEEVKEEVGWKEDVDLDGVLEWFMNPEYTPGYNLEWSVPNSDKIYEIMVEKHDFSKKRITNRLESMRETIEQKGLKDFF